MSMWNPNSFEDIMRRDAFENSVIEFGGGVTEILFLVVKVGLPLLLILAVLQGIGVHVSIGAN